jgi:hypothetical protein
MIAWVMGVHSRRCARCLVPSPVLGEGRGECMISVTNSVAVPGGHHRRRDRAWTNVNERFPLGRSNSVAAVAGVVGAFVGRKEDRVRPR